MKLIVMDSNFKCVVSSINSKVSSLSKAQQASSSSTPIIQNACDCLRQGGVVALPTDTIYGIATQLSHVHRLFHVKRRSSLKPVAICLANINEIEKWAVVSVPVGVLRALLPGPYTLLFKRTAALPVNVNEDTAVIGVRVPDHAVVRQLCSALGAPIALTSANTSGAPSASSIHEFEELWPDLDMVLDGGSLDTAGNAGSTVIDLSVQNTYRIVRQGCADMSHTKSVMQQYELEQDSSYF